MFAVDRRTKILTLGAMCFALFMAMLDNTVELLLHAGDQAHRFTVPGAPFRPGGIAEVFLIGRTFIGNSRVGLILGDDGMGHQIPRAAMWKPDGTVVDLNTLLPPGSGFSLYDATGINDNGDIVGLAAHDLHGHGREPLAQIRLIERV